MDILAALGQGLAQAMQWHNVLWALVGCVVGTAIGVLPGFGASAAMALLLPLLPWMDVVPALVLLLAIACGGMYGGSTASILRNQPGDSTSAVTAMEGNHMARHGQAGAAIATAALGSVVAGLLAAGLVIGLAPWAARVAQGLHPAAVFMLMLMAAGAVCVGLGRSALRGALALAIGGLLAWLGQQLETASQVVPGGAPWSRSGTTIAVVAIGLFVVAEVFHAALYERGHRTSVNVLQGWGMTRLQWQRSWPAWLRGTAIGFPFGCVPLGGVDMPTYVSYATEKYLARAPYRAAFGSEGAIEGVAGPEAANNATVTAALIPLLVMGIPTSNATAVILGAFYQYTLPPAPQWLAASGHWVWALLAALGLINVVLLVLNWPLVRMWLWLWRIPRSCLHAGMLLMAGCSVYVLRHNWLDVVVLCGCGAMGVAMRRAKVPATPLLIGLALAPQLAWQWQQALVAGQGHWLVLVQQPVALALLVLCAVLVVAPVGLQHWVQRRLRQARMAKPQA